MWQALRFVFGCLVAVGATKIAAELYGRIFGGKASGTREETTADSDPQ